MKPYLTLFCVTLITAPLSSAFASDLTLGDLQARLESSSNTHHATLHETRSLLKQISQELQISDTDSGLRQSQDQPHAQTEEALHAIEPQAASTSAPDPRSLVISEKGDLNMSCGNLSKEAMHMRDIIHTTQDIKNAAKMRSHGVTAAGAIGSFLIGSVTGGVGLAVGGFLLEQNIGAAESDADEIQDIAKQRRTLMMGIYNAKGCAGPLEHAMQNPEVFKQQSSKLASAHSVTGRPSIGYNN